MRIMCRCNQCNREITPSPSAPIAVTVRDPTHRLELSFHDWACFAIWVNAQAGEPLMPDLDCAGGLEFWEQHGL
jgi:hypothetical protein